MPKHVFPELRETTGSRTCWPPTRSSRSGTSHRAQKAQPASTRRCRRTARFPPDFFPGCRHDFRRQCLQIGIRSSRSSRTHASTAADNSTASYRDTTEAFDHQQVAVRRIHRPQRLRKLFPVSHHRIENDQWPVFSLRRIQRKLLFSHI